VASTSHDNSIKFYDISGFIQQKLEETVKVEEKEDES
jgi:hypothetical protein